MSGKEEIVKKSLATPCPGYSMNRGPVPQAASCIASLTCMELLQSDLWSSVKVSLQRDVAMDSMLLQEVISL